MSPSLPPSGRLDRARQRANVARLVKIGFVPPAAEIADPGQMHAQPAGIIIAPPQPLGRLGQQMLRKIVRAFLRAQVRLQHMLMADAFGIARRRRLDIDAVQHLVKQQPVDPAPHLA